MARRTDEERIQRDRNTARFFVENPGLALLVLIATVAWGVFGYVNMPKRKDPEIPIRAAVVVCQWPGIGAERIEELVTRKIEAKLSENGRIDHLDSIVRTNVSITYVLLREVDDVEREFENLEARVRAITDLPEGAGPIVFEKDFRDVSTLMLTVASPRADAIEIGLRARSVQRAIAATRGAATSVAERASLVVCFPDSLPGDVLRRHMAALADWLESSRLASDVRAFDRPGFAGLDARVTATDAELLASVGRFVAERLRQSDLHPDVWAPAVIRDPAQTEVRLAAVAGPRYSYRELDRHTELLQRILLGTDGVAKVTRTGILPEAVYLGYSQERLASYGLAPFAVRDAFTARNVALPGGLFESGGRSMAIAVSGEFESERELGDVVIGGSPRGSPAYVRDLFEISRDYQSPPRFLNTHAWRDERGVWQRSRAITLSVIMRSGDQIAEFGDVVERALAGARPLLPEDLIVARTSDQPQQVRDNVALFMRSLWEAIVLVVLVAVIGFREWRTALLVALSIPLTLAMTFGMMHALSIDLQQVSIGSLIIALGLLIDDPIVAVDAIRRETAAGRTSRVAAWLGPTKLASAIVFATVTNIVAYLPLLIVRDHVGDFIYSLPVVLTCSLVASRVVSMTFVPLLGMQLLRAGEGRVASPGRLLGVYRRLVHLALERRGRVLALCAVVLVVGAGLLATVKPSFFPKDLSHLFYIDVWLPADAPVASSAETATRTEEVLRRFAEEYGRSHPGRDGKPREILRSVTTFVGGGGPRFWFSLVPEVQQFNYAQLVVQVNDDRDTNSIVGPLQRALSEGVVGATVDVRQLETGEPVGAPIAIRFSGLDLRELRSIAERAKQILRANTNTERVRDDWGADGFALRLQTDPDRANLSGVTNLDVALSSLAATNGLQVATLRDRDLQIPVLLRLRPEERSHVDELQNLYVFSARGAQRVPLRQVASLGYQMQPEKVLRRDHARAITVLAFPVDGVLASTVLAQVRPALERLGRELPAGHRMAIAGEEAAQKKSFAQVWMAMLMSIALIYLALAFEFRSAVKPFIVFAAIPFGMVGALASLAIMREPFGFMAFLGIASLMGVIVSHVIVLFDFIEEAHEAGFSLEEALVEAGVVRLRPVLITVGATVIGLFPLAFHGGPLWEPLCFAQIGGLTVATAITLVLVPVLYAICVRDLRIVRWERTRPTEPGSKQ